MCVATLAEDRINRSQAEEHGKVGSGQRIRGCCGGPQLVLTK